MPDEVKKAMTAGIEVKRQGEFFFTKISDECPIKVDLTDEEKEIIKYRPSRFGFKVALTVDRWDDDKPFSEYDETSKKDIGTTEDKKAFKIAALKYCAVMEKYNNITAHSGTLGKSTTGSHKVDQFIKSGEITYVSGTVKQERRQHGDLVLTGWYKVIPNTGVFSWTITGDID
jgi:hypothetical protein